MKIIFVYAYIKNMYNIHLNILYVHTVKLKIKKFIHFVRLLLIFRIFIFPLESRIIKNETKEKNCIYFTESIYRLNAKQIKIRDSVDN